MMKHSRKRKTQKMKLLELNDIISEIQNGFIKRLNITEENVIGLKIVLWK